MADLISRAALLESFKRDFTPTLWEDKYIVQNIMEAPTVDAEPVRHAEWIPWEHNGKANKHLMTCSGCRRYQWPKNDVLAFDRCPKCGAFMKREKKNA